MSASGRYHKTLTTSCTFLTKNPLDPQTLLIRFASVRSAAIEAGRFVFRRKRCAPHLPCTFFRAGALRTLPVPNVSCLVRDGCATYLEFRMERLPLILRCKQSEEVPVMAVYKGVFRIKNHGGTAGTGIGLPGRK